MQVDVFACTLECLENGNPDRHWRCSCVAVHGGSNSSTILSEAHKTDNDPAIPTIRVLTMKDCPVAKFCDLAMCPEHICPLRVICY